MSTTRERALDAAIELVGREGIRSLTHGRVDAAASLPPGSTSNHFRTRAALISGVIDWLALSELADAGPPEVCSRDELVDWLVRSLEAQSGPLAARTRARFALFLEADSDSARPLRSQRTALESWVRQMLSSVGGPSAANGTAFLLATYDGLLLHRITVDPASEIRDNVARAVDCVLGR